MRTTVVLKDVKAGDLPQAWRRRVKAKTDERLTVTITRPKPNAAKKKPNATFGMWADRTDLTGLCPGTAGAAHRLATLAFERATR